MWPEVPEELRTARLRLRCPRPGDGVLVHAAVVESLSALRAWPASLPWALVEPAEAVSEAYCRDSAAAFLRREALVYLAFDLDGTLVASTSLHAIDWRVPKCEVGFWCRAGRQRQGLTGEAVRALMSLAFDRLGMHRVTALPDAENLASRAVCEAAGMVLEGVMRRERTAPDGRLRDTCLYARVRA